VVLISTVFDKRLPARSDGSTVPVTINSMLSPGGNVTNMSMSPLPPLAEHVAPPGAAHVHEAFRSSAGMTSVTRTSVAVEVPPMFETLIV
jgi:hypothetical protein